MTGRSSHCPELAAHPPGWHWRGMWACLQSSAAMFQSGAVRGTTRRVGSRRIVRVLVSRHVPCLFSLRHGHGPGGRGANSALYSPLGEMHDEGCYYRAGRESRLVPADAINTPCPSRLEPSPLQGSVHWSIPSLSLSLSCEPQARLAHAPVPLETFCHMGNGSRWRRRTLLGLTGDDPGHKTAMSRLCP